MIALLLILSLAWSCAQVPNRLKYDKFYKRDMLLEVNNLKGRGVLVVPAAQKYTFKVESRGKMDYFSYSTCARDEGKEEAWDEGWFKSKYKVNFEFIPNSKLESRACPMQLGGYEKIKGRHSWAFIAFQDAYTKLKAKLTCNGRLIDSQGVSVCQSREGLFQEIEFSTEVITAKGGDCAMPKSKGKVFRWEIKKGHCVYAFMENKKKGKLHRMHTLGYESALVRGD